MSMFSQATGWLHAGGVPNPGTGDAPPEVKAGLDKGLGLLAQIGIYSCVAGLLITAATMAVLYRQNQVSDHYGRIGLVVTGCVLIGGASSIVNFFI